MMRCSQCWKLRPTVDFRSADGTRYVQRCIRCRERYGDWSKLSPEERIARMRAAPRPRPGIGYMAALVLESRNRKTGPIPVSVTDMSSCPDACGFRDTGCYAEFGKLRYQWERVAGDRGASWAEFCRQIAALPPGQLWHHNEAGDLPGPGNTLDVQALDQLVAANAGRRGFTFTHKPLETPEEREAVRRANALGFTINLSAESLEEADRFADLDIAPVTVVVPHDEREARFETPAGRQVFVCLNQTRGYTCVECRICANPERKTIVAFRAHGQAKQLVTELVRKKRLPVTEEVNVA
jgi:hypothetical protein